MANLASTYRDLGRWKEAEELKVQVMKIRKRLLGEEHPSTDQHDQPRINVQGSSTIERGQRAADADDEDEKEAAG